MALTAHTDGLTAEAICTQCENLAGRPNLHLHPTTGAAPTTEAELDATPAYIWLNEIIQHRLMTAEWPFLETAANITLAARETNLPTDYWRQRFDHDVYVLEGENRHRLRRYTPEAWHSGIVAAPAPQARPYAFFIDKARQTIFVHPTPDQSYTAEMHYLRTIGRITARTQVPGLDPNSRASLPYPWLLVKMLLQQYMLHQNDSRVAIVAAEVQQMYTEVRASAYEPFDSSPAIPLDTATFPTPRYD